MNTEFHPYATKVAWRKYLSYYYESYPTNNYLYKNFKYNNGSQLIRAIIMFLRYEGWVANRINTTGTPIIRKCKGELPDGKDYTYKEFAGWRPSGATPGMSDIIATIDGKTYYIEVKYGKDRLSKNQKKFKEDITRRGANYWVVNSFNDFVEKYLRENFTPNPVVLYKIELHRYRVYDQKNKEYSEFHIPGGKIFDSEDGWLLFEKLARMHSVDPKQVKIYYNIIK